jgi:hypothetical protein
MLELVAEEDCGRKIRYKSNFVKILYEKEACKKCNGQIMTIFVKKEIIDRKCVKCDNPRIRIRPVCEEEYIGRLMHIYYVTGRLINDKNIAEFA